MKLSDAIRKGCQLTQPGYGLMVQEHRAGTFACALGAAWIGLKGRLPTSPREANIRILEDIWPCLTDVHTPSPPAILDLRDTGSLRQSIIDLNDVVEWPRERIADWLDTLAMDLESTD